ncbi:gliding motility protein RemB [Mucilaginibacter sp. HMF5004]|uniref:gliding motility protein RemB n=1 Tax=Mucilaginibacter rivuli TaxID=2857527 RepID=UPI001C5FE731|nr:gliding motility protein RemB [Mucilaginibacter rivuli]MBW4890075.1 gliding motility protein RemB [Mucilaginibacter rivuli]
MKYKLPECCKIFTVFFITVSFTVNAYSQIIYQPYSYQFYQKLNSDIYSTGSALHTAIKPYCIADSALKLKYDSLLHTDLHTPKKSWLHRILFDQHMVDIKKEDYTFYFDYITDLQLGREFQAGTSTNLNTRGYQAGGTIGSKFFFYTSGFENQGKFANYVQNYINTVKVVPGQAPDRSLIGQSSIKNSSDWSYVTSMIGFAPSKNLSFELGQDKTFIGDGYRSVLLSDYAANYPLLRLKADFGKVQYMAMWAYMDDQRAVTFDLNKSGPSNRRKWGVFHYIDWNVTNKLSAGFFNALIAAETDDKGNRHGFDFNYINPVLFVPSLGPGGPIPDHALFGFNGKYKVLSKTTVYGQLLFDQSTGSSDTRTAYQLGFRGADLFKVNTLNYLFEYNTASPYTYANQNPVVSYANFSEPLAHPFGANFQEWLGIMNYSVGKFDFQGEVIYSRYGLNTNSLNYGKDITQADNVSLPAGNASTTQGLATSLKYAEGTVSYMLNPKFNLRVELSGLYREETNNLSTTKTTLITIGLRSSFRNLYHDF